MLHELCFDLEISLYGHLYNFFDWLHRNHVIKRNLSSKISDIISTINQEQYLGIGYNGQWRLSPFDDKYPHHLIEDNNWKGLEIIKETTFKGYVRRIARFKRRSKKNQYIHYSL